MYKVAVIIPLALREGKLPNLSVLPSSWQVVKAVGFNRADAMNQAAYKTNADYFWFLHADSVISQSNIEAIEQALTTNNKSSLYYFKLQFVNAQGKLCQRLNATGANLRSKLFKNPFGDQGFFVSRTLFLRAGAYNQQASYGEDNLFAMQVKSVGGQVKCLQANIGTSNRKYASKGMVKITFLHQYLWLKQKLIHNFTLPKTKDKTAIAIFCKTPNLSLPKTRLAKQTSQEFANKFYKLALAASLQEIYQVTNADCYIAPAEETAQNNQFWQGHRLLPTNSQSFGEGLFNVYNSLLQKGYKNVVLYGTDSPHIMADDISTLINKVDKNAIFGSCQDGGFYLMASSINIEKDTFTNIEYSTSTTLENLMEGLNKAGVKTEVLDNSFDIDEKADLDKLKEALEKHKQEKRPLSYYQEALLELVSKTKI